MAAKKKGINIKPKNKGKFTSYCKSKGYSGVTSSCINSAKKSKSAAIRKEANFAANSRKWNKSKKKK